MDKKTTTFGERRGRIPQDQKFQKIQPRASGESTEFAEDDESTVGARDRVTSSRRRLVETKASKNEGKAPKREGKSGLSGLLPGETSVLRSHINLLSGPRGVAVSRAPSPVVASLGERKVPEERAPPPSSPVPDESKGELWNQFADLVSRLSPGASRELGALMAQPESPLNSLISRFQHLLQKGEQGSAAEGKFRPSLRDLPILASSKTLVLQGNGNIQIQTEVNFDVTREKAGNEVLILPFGAGETPFDLASSQKVVVSVFGQDSIKHFVGRLEVPRPDEGVNEFSVRLLKGGSEPVTVGDLLPEDLGDDQKIRLELRFNSLFNLK